MITMVNFGSYFFIILFIIQCGVSAPVLNTDIWEISNSEEYNLAKSYNGVNINEFSRFPRVLNFFTLPVEEECNANDGRRKGICMNTYECRMEGGKSYGFCAHGFGVCCVFTSTCDQEIRNNLTYFVNPDFPDLTKIMTSCSLTVRKINDDIAQLRFDFIHFNLGQPNRQTGVCEEDNFLLTAGNNNRDINLCGLNSGQHIYFDVDDSNGPITINMNLSRKAVTRLWEVRITQIPFSQRARAGCLQYFEGPTGIIQTMNFADNGRHLANQDYNICIRQEEGMCSIAYEPCHENAFRISPNTDNDNNIDVGSGDGFSNGESRQMQVCNDRVTVPCDSDDLLSQEDDNIIQEVCDNIYCGPSLCPNGENPCRIESNVIPFVVGVHFGEKLNDESPEDNLGMCLIYEQLPCNV